jgi:hypothetical protein
VAYTLEVEMDLILKEAYMWMKKDPILEEA